MIDEKYLELIHAEIDGVLPERQRAELSRYLLANAEASTHRDELRRLAAALNGLGAVEPPDGLRQAILDALPPPAPQAGRPQSPGALRFFRPSAALQRYAAAFAAGALLATVAFQIGLESRGGPGVSELVGTMVDHRQAGQAVRADTVTVDLDQVRGEVKLFEAQSMLLVEFDLALQQPVEIVVSFDDQEARLEGRATHAGGAPERYAMSLARTGGGSAVNLKFFASGILIHEDTLEVAAAR